MKESKFWKSIKENLSDVFWCRLESWASPGVPDVYGCADGISFFLELKTVTQRNRLQISPFQKSWHFSHSLQGGRSFIMRQHHEQRLLYIFQSSIAHQISPSPPYHTSSVTHPWPLERDAWQQVREWILHCPLQKPENG